MNGPCLKCTNNNRCGHCQALTPEYKKAASALKGIVRLGAVNADEHRSLGSRYGVQGFPAIKVFGTNKNSPTDYRGNLVNAVIYNIHSKIDFCFNVCV